MGSEMCIRDRSVSADGTGDGGTGPGAFDLPAAQSQPHGGGAHYRCLLYTSDAADERSSVDLGGRRIIKKKNNTELGGSSLCSIE